MNAHIWKSVTIGDLFSMGAGKAITPRTRLGEKKYPFLRTSNVLWGRIDTVKVDSMDFSPEEFAAKSLRSGDLLVCEGGAIGRSAVWNGEVDNCSFQNHLHRLRPRTNAVAPRFFMYYLQAGFTQLGIYEGAGNKTTIPNLSSGRLAALKVPFPGKIEQEKIAAILWKLQRAIATQDSLIGTTRELKQASMARLFTRGRLGQITKETELGLMPDSWNVSTIGQVAQIGSGGTPSRTNPTYWVNGIIPWVKTGEVDYCVITQTEEKITELGMRESAARIYPKGTLLVAMYGQGITRGKVAILGIDAATNQACAALRITEEAVHTEFLYQMLTYGYQRLRDLAHGGQQQNLNADLIRSFSFGLPPTLDEQRDIAAALNTIDKKVAHHQHKRAALNDLFQTLLHKLMTAEIRVTDLDIDTTEISASVV